MAGNKGLADRIFNFSELAQADLIIDAVYASGASKKGLADEVISKLLPGMQNAQGFRYSGTFNKTQVVVLVSTGSELEWPDELNPYSGTFVYFGDNRRPGKSLHDTPKKGNEILRNAFELAHSNDPLQRAKCPIFLIFEKTGKRHDVRFRGFAVPGAKNLGPDDDLIAIWRVKDGQRFQNYRAVFTVLDPGAVDIHLSGAWIRECIKKVHVNYSDPRVPSALSHWVETGRLTPLISKQKNFGRSPDQQIPTQEIEREITNAIYDFCKDDPFFFEEVAAEFWRLYCEVNTDIETTRQSKDGGRDALGWIALGPASDAVELSFAMEAKCYSPKNGVGVKELSRLISRLKHREFGVLITTSFVSPQAYKELRTDGHPVIVFSGVDMARVLHARGISNKIECIKWLEGIPKKIIS